MRSCILFPCKQRSGQKGFKSQFSQIAACNSIILDLKCPCGAVPHMTLSVFCRSPRQRIYSIQIPFRAYLDCRIRIVSDAVRPRDAAVSTYALWFASAASCFSRRPLHRRPRRSRARTGRADAAMTRRRRTRERRQSSSAPRATPAKSSSTRN